MQDLKALYLLGADAFPLIYGPDEQAAIGERVEIYAPPQTPESVKANPEVLAEADVIFSGWGMCRVDQAFLDAAPNLKAIFYAAGGAHHVATPEAVARGVVVTTAIEANSIPVAEYTLATIIFSLKHGWRLMRETRDRRRFVDRNTAPGCYRRTVGVVSLGTIGRLVVDRLRPLEADVLAYDPFVSEKQAKELGVELVSLDALFERSDVVSLHAPAQLSTVGMVRGEHLASMKPGATFINTARGVVVRQDELIDVATRRTDLQFVLDVTDTPEQWAAGLPEWPEASSALYTLPNVVLTPHMAGSVGQECRRMSRWMVEELQRYLAGEPLKWQITPRVERPVVIQPGVKMAIPSVALPAAQPAPRKTVRAVS